MKSMNDLSCISAYIDGEWRCNESDYFSLSRPQDNRIVGHRFGNARIEDLTDALAAARTGQARWQHTSVVERGRALTQAAAFIRAEAGKIAQELHAEAGKPMGEAEAEVATAAEFLDTFAHWAQWGAHGALRHAKGRVLTEKRPRGIAALITPWNYPISNPCQKLGAALIAGNAVIWRPSGLTPACSVALARAFEHADMPSGVFNFFLEKGDTLSRRLIESTEIQAVSFTGSTRVGLQIATAAAARGAAVQCEMGGKNAAIVMPDADIQHAAERIAYGAFSFAGQKCTALSRLLVHHDVMDAFHDALARASTAYQCLSARQINANCAPLITRAQHRKLLTSISTLNLRGLKIAQGGEAPMSQELAHGNYIEPTVLTADDTHDRVWTEELFGPVLLSAPFNHLSNAVESVNHNPYGLAAAIFTDSSKSIQFAIDHLDVGVLKINEATPGLDPYSPAGGWKQSGLGPNELTEDGVEFFSRKKAVYLG
ncbi:aldehyde dehydrogenase family protein [Parapusillimonas sp. JC17]|uniref:aldehyde dehydrogenase family protein n=1 Tax=Parapusillimonas sp. JC17 TaxID=3445768 RepID=UPI003FA09DBB